MSPSLPSLPLVAATPRLSTVASLNTDINPLDNISSNDFGEMLGDAHSALATGAPDAGATPLDGERFLAELQMLPPAGKTLPLLQQTLEKLDSAGISLEQFADRLASKLKALTQDAATPPEQQLAVALQQVLKEQPALKAVLPADTLAAIAQSVDALPGIAPLAETLPGNGQSADALTTIAQSADALTKSLSANHDNANELARRMAEMISQKTTVSSNDLQQYSLQSASTERGTFVLDAALSPLQQSIAASEQGQADTMAMLAGLKRLLADNKPSASPELPTRAESLLSGTLTPNAAAPPSPASAVPTVTVPVAFGQAGWEDAFGERIQWLVSQKVQGAQVKLNPANLGPMEVRIQMQNDQASIQFSSHHAVVREALEAALPRLREMLEASGLQLVDVDVSGQQSFAGRQQATQDPHSPYLSGGLSGDESEQEIRVQTPLAAFDGRGRLDLFA